MIALKDVRLALLPRGRAEVLGVDGVDGVDGCVLRPVLRDVLFVEAGLDRADRLKML